jgi:GNAT superfamily N-acetyltransferase
VDRIVTRNNKELTVRPLRRRDKDVLIDVFEHLGEESRYKRFLRPIKELTHDDLSYLTAIDHEDSEALVAISPDGDPVGVARYIRLAEKPSAAEVAVTVVDEWQGRGVGYALIRQLAERARQVGIETFIGICLTGNREMIQLLHELGPTVRDRYDHGGAVEVEVELPTDADPATTVAHLRAAGRAAERVAR